MKSSKKDIKEYVRSLIKAYLSEAEKEEEPADDETKEENPFAATDDKGGEESEEDPKKDKQKPAEPPAGIPISFDISKVKQYNKVNFLSNSGIVKSIDKRGVIVTTQPDGVDVLVNFNDISENVKRFFKNKN
jgi:hypothetical protein